MSFSVSIIIPALNEGEGIEATLSSLADYRSQGHQVIVVDGGSSDDTVARATPLADRVVSGDPGRAKQMNAGAGVASGEVLLFLHADTQLPSNALGLIEQAMGNHRWGRFDVRLSGSHWMFRVIERMMNWRSCCTGIATGDQAIFIQRALFDEIGGFPEQPLMEDIEISKRLKSQHAPACLHTPLTTSSRRWEQRGILRTILLMWRLRWLYWRGVDAERLARMYR